MPFGSRPASSANRQNRIRSRKWATASRVVAAVAQALGDLGEVAGGLLGDLGRLDARAELLGRGEDVAQERAGRRTGRRPPRSSSVTDLRRPGCRPVKLVWISIRSRSLTTRSGGLPRSSGSPGAGGRRPSGPCSCPCTPRRRSRASRRRRSRPLPRPWRRASRRRTGRRWGRPRVGVGSPSIRHRSMKCSWDGGLLGGRRRRATSRRTRSGSGSAGSSSLPYPSGSTFGRLTVTSVRDGCHARFIGPPCRSTPGA